MRFKTLARQGRAAAKARGHALTPLDKSEGRPAWVAQCVRCRAFLSVIVSPYPNEIEVGGAAVAVNCPQPIRET